jgi:hypothetical protein
MGAHPAGDDSNDTDDWVFLMGRPPMGAALTFIRESSAGGNVDLARLADEWRAAHGHIRQLEKAEAGLADDPPIAGLPEALKPLEKKVLSDPVFRESYFMVPSRIAMVDLDRLVVYQKHINLEFARKVQEALGPEPSGELVFRTCLPYDHPMPGFSSGRITQNGFTFLSPSTDLRFLDATLLRPEQVIGYSPPGPVAAVLGLVVGFGSNFLNAVLAERRLILNNGSHRAYALREMGIRQVPCIVQEAQDREELSSLVSPDVFRQADRLLGAPRPPLLKDYFDPALRKLFKGKRKARQVRLTFDVEQLDLPAR